MKLRLIVFLMIFSMCKGRRTSGKVPDYLLEAENCTDLHENIELSETGQRRTCEDIKTIAMSFMTRTCKITAAQYKKIQDTIDQCLELEDIFGPILAGAVTMDPLPTDEYDRLINVTDEEEYPKEEFMLNLVTPKVQTSGKDAILKISTCFVLFILNLCIYWNFSYE